MHEPKPPKKQGRSPGQRAADDMLISDLALKGFRYPEISAHMQEKLGRTLSVPMISKIVKRLRKGWLAKAIESQDALIRDECEKLAVREREAWDAWERSKAERVVRQAKRRKGAGDTGEGAGEVMERKEGQVGDPRFLEIVAKVCEQRMRLLGIIAPQQVEVAGKDGEPISVAVTGTVVILPEEKMHEAVDE